MIQNHSRKRIKLSPFFYCITQNMRCINMNWIKISMIVLSALQLPVDTFQCLGPRFSSTTATPLYTLVLPQILSWVSQHEWSHHLIIFMCQNMTVIDKARKLNQLVFRYLEIRIWIDPFFGLITSWCPSNSHHSNMKIWYHECILPLPLVRVDLLGVIFT